MENRVFGVINLFVKSRSIQAAAWIMSNGNRVYEQTFISENNSRAEAAYLAAEGIAKKIEGMGLSDVEVHTDHDVLVELNKLQRHRVNSRYAAIAIRLNSRNIVFCNINRQPA